MAKDSVTAAHPPGVEKLDHSALRDRVYDNLAAALHAGRFAPGEAITLRGLAALLGTSPMPIREAVGRLITEGAIEALPNRTMRVPQISLAALEDLTDVRKTVEGEAAALAATRLTPDSFAEVRNANEAYGRAVEQNDVAQALVTNRDFHFAIYRASGSPLLMSIIKILWLRGGPFIAAELRSMSVRDELARQSGLAHHYEMLAALAARDAKAMHAAMRADIGDAAAWYRNTFFPSPAEAAGPA